MEAFCVHIIFVPKKKKHVYLAFKLPHSDYNYFDKVIDLISHNWERRKIFFAEYEMIYPRLISSMKWKFDYVFFEKKREKRKVVKGVDEQHA